MTKITLLSTGLLIAGFNVLTAATALAADAADSATQTRMVRFDDLNLATDAGVAALNHRIRVAARQVCDETGAPVSLGDTCVAGAVQKARANTGAMIAAARIGGSFAVAAVTPGH